MFIEHNRTRPTERLRDETIGSGLSSVLAAKEELQLRRAGALSKPDRTCELDAAVDVSAALCTWKDKGLTSRRSRCCGGQ